MILFAKSVAKVKNSNKLLTIFFILIKAKFYFYTFVCWGILKLCYCYNNAFKAY